MVHEGWSYNKEPTALILLNSDARGIPKLERSCTVKGYVHIAIRVPLCPSSATGPLELSHLAPAVEGVGCWIVCEEVDLSSIEGG